jgi:hypothetical protein
MKKEEMGISKQLSSPCAGEEKTHAEKGRHKTAWCGCRTRSHEEAVLREEGRKWIIKGFGLILKASKSLVTVTSL